MKKNINKLSTIYKGFLIGSTMLIPGVSGGSMAIILGIYDRLVRSVSSFTKNKKDNFLFLLLFVASAGLGMFLLAKPILVLWELYPRPMGFFFMGAVAGGVPTIYKESKVEKIKGRSMAYVLLGLMIVVVMSLVEGDTNGTNYYSEEMSMFYLALAGVVAAVALVLPGISVSFLLLFMGLYDELMKAITEMDMSFLMPMGCGILLGVLLVTKALDIAMKKYPKVTYMIILGFILGSLLEVFPGMPRGIEWVWCIVAVVVGFYIIATLSIVESK